MSIQVTCEGCAYEFKVKQALLGKRVKCPECGESIKVQLSACPACGVELEADAVVCVECGFDSRTGKHHGVVKKETVLKRPLVFLGVFASITLYATILVIPIALAWVHVHAAVGIVFLALACAGLPVVYWFTKDLLVDKYELKPAIKGSAPTFARRRYLRQFRLITYGEVNLDHFSRVHVFQGDSPMEGVAKGMSYFVIVVLAIVFCGPFALLVVFFLGMSSKGTPSRLVFCGKRVSRDKSLLDGMSMEFLDNGEMNKVVKFLKKNTDLQFGEYMDELY